MEKNRQSQIHPIEGFGNHFYMMREDLLPFSMGGNKVRIADAFFQDMSQKKCDVMIAYGNARSNLCRVIANECRRQKIPCYIICSHEDGEDTGMITANSRIMTILGATMVPCSKSEIAQTVEKLMKTIESQGKKPYYIYGDKYGRGNEGVSTRAYTKAYEQIKSYEQQEGITFDYIFHASGTGATQAGLTCGHLLAKDKTKVVGILISSREYPRALSIIKEGMSEYFQWIGREDISSYDEEIILESAYTKGGYGVYDEEILDCIRQQLTLNGIPLDPTYTGKAFWGMQEYIKKEKIKNANILFIHTGGTPLFYDCLTEGRI